MHTNFQTFYLRRKLTNTDKKILPILVEKYFSSTERHY